MPREPFPTPDAFLARLYPHGLFRRDGAVVGYWYVTSASHLEGHGVDEAIGSSLQTVRGLLRLPGGLLVGVDERMPHSAWDPETWAASTAATGGVRHSADAFALSLALALGPLEAAPSLADPERAFAYHVATTHGHRFPVSTLHDDTLERALAGHLSARRRLLDAFVATLDPDLVALLRDPVIRLPRVEHCWRGLEGRGWDRTPLRRAFALMPRFALTLLAAWRLDPDGFDEAATTPHGIERVVVEHLVTVHGMTRPAVARSVSAAAAIDAWDVTVAEVAAIVQRRFGKVDLACELASMTQPFPANWSPRGPAEWAAMLRSVPAVDHALRMPGPVVADLPALLDAGGGWVACHARLSGLAGDAGLASALADTGEPCRRLARELLLPAVALSGAPPGPLAHMDVTLVGAAVLHRGRSLAAMLDVSERWHRNLGRMDERRESLPSVPWRDDPWPAGLPDASREGLRIVVLRTRRELADEGRRGANEDGSEGLDHCVGGYASDCRSGRSRILSVRRAGDGPPDRVATLGIDVERDPMVVFQHAARTNSRPGRASVAAVELYMRDLAEGVLEIDRGAFVPMPVDDGLDHFAGYDFRHPGNWEVMRDLWSRVLPRHLRDADVETFARLALDPANHGGWRPRAAHRPSPPLSEPPRDPDEVDVSTEVEMSRGPEAGPSPAACGSGPAA